MLIRHPQDMTLIGKERLIAIDTSLVILRKMCIRKIKRDQLLQLNVVQVRIHCVDLAQETEVSETSRA